MTAFEAAPQVLLSPVLLDIITTYQPGCYEDMRVFESVRSPLQAIAIILRSRTLWRKGGQQRDPFASFHQVVTAWYAQVGHSRLTKLFACMPHMRDIVVAHAVFSGNLGVLARLPVDVVRAVEIPLLDLAAMKGHFDVVMYLHADVGYDGCTKWAVDFAAQEGHVDVVAYLLANRREECSTYAFHGAAKNGHLDIVKCLHAHYSYQPHESFYLALRIAASHNHFTIVSYIIDLYGPAKRFSTRAMDQAARNGQLEMVQFLHERNFECTTGAMNRAAAGGHLDVVKWLHENRTEGCTEKGINRAATQGHLEVVQWLHDRYTFST